MIRRPLAVRRAPLVCACLLAGLFAAASCASDEISTDRARVQPGGGGGGARSSLGGAAGSDEGPAGADSGGSAGISSAGAAGTSPGGAAGALFGGAAGTAQGGAAGAKQGGAAGAGGRTELSTECPTDAPGPKMIRIERADGRAACIDQREVTQGEYHAFVATVGIEGYMALGYCEPPGPKGTVYGYDRPEPTLGPPYAAPGTVDFPVYGVCDYGYWRPDLTPDAAAGCLYQCQAQKYCAWAGKELCGRFDSDEPLDDVSAVDPASSIWAAACTNGGTTTRSHAADDPEACGPPWSKDVVTTDARPEAHPACHGEGPYAEIFNLSGGVGEWVNAVHPPTETTAAFPMGLGPSPLPQPGSTGCGRALIGFPDWGLGFRCCKRLAEK